MCDERLTVIVARRVDDESEAFVGDGGVKLTVFGATMLELMGKRGITGWTSLSDHLAKGGYDFKPPRISNWAYGRHPVSGDFARAFASTLELDEEEATRLALAFTYKQDEKVKLLASVR